MSSKKILFIFLHSLAFLLLSGNYYLIDAKIHHPKLVLRDTPYTRLCETKNILTVNGQFPGPTINVQAGDTLLIDIVNKAKENITIHWHGVKQHRFPWTDGPEYITQCPIRPGGRFSQKIVLTDEIGTLWWHAHSDWSRATVHGLLIVHPCNGTRYPFPQFQAEVPVVLGEWWKADIMDVLGNLENGGTAPLSDAYLINGQPGDLYPCSRQDTFKLKVDPGKTYLLRMVNAIMNNILFFAVANHSLTVVGSDGSYTKPVTSDYIVISPGQTMDILLRANQPPGGRYYMAARVFDSVPNGLFGNTTTTAIVEYSNGDQTAPPQLSDLPDFEDVDAATSFTRSLRSLASAEYPIDVPKKISTKLFFALSFNLLPCSGSECAGPNGTRLAASVNNISFVHPRIDILQAYYHRINGIFGDDFPDFPLLPYNYTADFLPLEMASPERRTEVKVLKYNSTVELVFQNTNLVAGVDHPMHLHGYNFYVVGTGFGNFDKEKDPLNYNLVDPPHQNTISVPRNGWVAIRFKASNPGVWLMHCHFERHISWGMEMVFIVRDGKRPEEKMLPPPPNMPPCL